MGKIFGQGINDKKYKVSSSVNGKTIVCPYYRRWYDMIRRCYDPKYSKKFGTYSGAEVCEEWKIFSNFKEWMESQCWEGKDLDKGLLHPGNKIYSPETCIFIDPAINQFVRGCLWPDKKERRGVSYHSQIGKYVARTSFKKKFNYIGAFQSEEEAYSAYCKKKKEIIVQYCDSIDDEKVKSALMRASELVCNAII